MPTAVPSTGSSSTSSSGTGSFGSFLSSLFGGSRTSSSGTSSGMEAEARRLDTTPRSGLGNLFYSLTSRDPGNIAANRAASAIYAAMPSYTRDSDPSGNFFRPYNSTGARPGEPGAAGSMGRGGKNNYDVVTRTDPPYGSPTIPMGPVEVATPTYGLPGLLPQPVSYGSAYSSLGAAPQVPMVNYADIFSVPGDLSFLFR